MVRRARGLMATLYLTLAGGNVFFLVVAQTRTGVLVSGIAGLVSVIAALEELNSPAPEQGRR